MEKVMFTFKRGGRTQSVYERQAKMLARAGLGTYQTRDMADMPKATKPMIPAPAVPADSLDGMDKDQLHAIAKERGIKVHHAAGADKVRAALREAE